ncbi:MAG TPA: TetR/AcrR family transcriptional regulator [Caulobacteraceae bacterium]|nr:TetR/AcrR family transcriptional regulator [Caulobacteraceae bacterium]
MKAPAEIDREAAAQDAEARARILGAAFGAFMEHGYRRTSTLEIATRAKVSKRDLYALVGNKQEILHACVANRARRMVPPGALPAAQSRPALVDTLTRFGATLITELCHPAVIGMHRLAIAEGRDSPEISREIIRTGEATRAAVAAFLADAQGAGLVDDGDPHAMAELFLDLVAAPWMMLRVLIGGDAPSAQQARRRAAAAVDAFGRLHLT